MHMTFDGSGGISIAASLVGDGLGRPPVLLAHGGGQTRRTWRKTMQQLAQHGYHSVAIDMRVPDRAYLRCAEGPCPKQLALNGRAN